MLEAQMEFTLDGKEYKADELDAAAKRILQQIVSLSAEKENLDNRLEHVQILLKVYTDALKTQLSGPEQQE